MPLKLFIIDTIGPFIINSPRKTINWSKIPFDDLEKNGLLHQQVFEEILGHYKNFLSQAAALGYNAVTMDDLAHLILFPFYPNPLRKKLGIYCDYYRQFFKVAKEHNLKIFINTDIIFFNKWIEKNTRGQETKIIALLQSAIEQLFREYDVDGVVFRIGESDGVDVKGDFISRLIIKTPKQANHYLVSLLPLFEKFKKLLIFRTWTVGAYPVGDLIWNRNTFQAVFKNINSPYFIISMKYGDSDFYDYLKLNPLFNIGNHQKIIELQTRREREGFGEFPYYVGWQYYNYYRQFKDNPNLIGISVWCQTGGWCRWKNYTYLTKSSPWNELNTLAAIQIFRYNKIPDDVLKYFLKEDKLIEFITLYYKVFRKLLYIKGFREKTLYVFRTRIPPLVWVFWDHIIINPLLIELLNSAEQKKFTIPKHQIKALHEMGEKLNIAEIDYLCDTLKALAISRRIFWKKAIRPRFTRQLQKYEKKYPHSFKFSINVRQASPGLLTVLLFKILLRTKAEYRWFDKILLSRPFSVILRFGLLFLRKSMPSFVNKQAMKVDWLVK